MTDMSGVLSDLSGGGSLAAVQMAVEDFGGSALGKPIVVLDVDHQNKADIAANKANEWFDVQKVDMITDLTNSSVALAVMSVAERKKRIAIVNGAGATRITNDSCTPYSIHYAWDTYAMANGTAKALLKRGGDTWFFLTADYAFGHQIERDVSQVVKEDGGKVLGSTRHPFNASDFSSFMLQAQASGAKIIGLANGGTDTINSIKSAREFKLLEGGRQSLAGLAVFITDIHGAGLAAAEGLLMTEAFYWDANEENRKWSKRFFERMKKMPTAIQAANYSSTLHYLQRGAGGGQHRRRPGDGKDEGNAGERLLREERADPRGRPHGPRHVPDAGQGAGRIEVPLGLLQDGGDDPGRPGVPAAGEVDLPAGEEAVRRTGRQGRRYLRGE